MKTIETLEQIAMSLRDIEGIASATVALNEDSLGHPTLEVEIYRNSSRNEFPLAINGLEQCSEGTGMFGPLLSFRLK